MDIDARVELISGIGPTRRRSLMVWREQIEKQAWASAPTSLVRNDEAAIRSKYVTQRNTLQMQADAIRRGMAEKESEIRNSFKVRNGALDRKADLVRLRSEQELKNIDRPMDQVRKDLLRTNWDAAKMDRQLMALKRLRFSRYIARLVVFNRKARVS